MDSILQMYSTAEEVSNLCSKNMKRVHKPCTAINAVLLGDIIEKSFQHQIR
jgi:hypothetical protein